MAEAPQKRGAERRVSSMPLLEMRYLYAPSQPLPYPFCEPNVSYWYNARAAIFQGLQSLGIRAGARVIVPAYSCGSEIDTLVKAGLELDFYRIGEDLNADLDDVQQLCQRPAAALFVTHFWGLAQPIEALAAIARRHHMLLVEDVSLAFYSKAASGRPLGSFGDMAVYSLWKTLPLPDGGVLRISPPAGGLTQPLPSKPPGLLSMMGRLRHMAEEGIAASHPALVRFLRQRLSDPAVRWIKGHLQQASPSAPVHGANPQGENIVSQEAAQAAFRPERGDWRMSALSAYLLPRVVDSAHTGLRRTHFATLAAGLRRSAAIRPLIDHLPERCCPLFFPVIAAEPRPFCRFLAAHNVGFFRAWTVFHPAVPWERFGFEARLKEDMVVLPIHQGLTDGDLQRIITVVNAWSDAADPVLA